MRLFLILFYKLKLFIGYFYDVRIIKIVFYFVLFQSLLPVAGGFLRPPEIAFVLPKLAFAPAGGLRLHLKKDSSCTIIGVTGYK